MTTWYKILLGAWLLTVVPVAMLAYGFSGDRFVFPDISAFGVEETINFILTSAWALSPLLLAPLGLRRRTRKPRDDGGSALT
jgi:hypothetical protein